MMQNLRPRVLNKAGTPSVIKSTEMLDAVNVVADGLDTSESNTIKKVPGNIRVFLNDPELELLINLLEEETVLGSCVDEQRQRIFYFTTSAINGVSRGSVYLLEQFDETEVKMTLLMKSNRLDFEAEDFVAADILRVPKQEKSYGVDPGDGETFEDGGDLEFDDDDVDVGSNVVITSCPSTQSTTINPISGSATTLTFVLPVENIGTGDAPFNSIQVGEGQGPEDPVEYGNAISIGLVNPEFFSSFFIQAGDSFNIQINVTIDDGQIEEGVYDFYANLYGLDGVLLGSCNFSVGLIVLDVQTPNIRLTSNVYGPGLNFANGLGSPYFMSINAGDPPAVAQQATNAPYGVITLQQTTGSGQIFPNLRVRFNKNITTNLNGELHQLSDWFDITVNEDFTTADVQDVNGVFVADLPDPLDPNIEKTFSVRLTLRTDAPVHGLGQLPPPSASNSMFSFWDLDDNPLEVNVLDGTTLFLTGTEIDLDIRHQLGEYEPPETPPSIVIQQNGQEFTSTIQANIEDNNELNGSEATLSFTVKNQGTQDGFYILNFGYPFASDFAAESAWRTHTYIAPGMQDYSALWGANLLNGGVDLNELDGTPLDLTSRIRPLAGGAEEVITIKVSNVGPEFETNFLTEVGQTNPYVGEFSFLGYPGNSVSSYISAAQVETPDVGVVDVFNSVSGADKVTSTVNVVVENVYGDLEISYHGDFFYNTGLFLSEQLTTLPYHIFDQGYQNANGSSFFVARNPQLNRIFDPIQANDLNILNGNGVFLPGTVGGQADYIVFDIKNTTIDTSAIPASVAVSTLTIPEGEGQGQTYTGALPASIQGWNTAGQGFHDPPGTLNNGWGSIGYVVMWTDEFSLIEYDGLYFNVNDFKYSYYSATAVYNEATTSIFQTHFGGYRNAPSISISPAKYRKVLIQPIFTTNTQQYLQSQGNFSTVQPFGIGYQSGTNNNLTPICTKISISATGGINPFEAKTGMIMHPLSQAQYQYVRDLDTFGDTPLSPPPPPPETQEESGSVPLSSVGSGDVGSTVSLPRSARTGRIKLKSSESKTKQKRKYGKRF